MKENVGRMWVQLFFYNFSIPGTKGGIDNNKKGNKQQQKNIGMAIGQIDSLNISIGQEFHNWFIPI